MLIYQICHRISRYVDKLQHVNHYNKITFFVARFTFSSHVNWPIGKLQVNSPALSNDLWGVYLCIWKPHPEHVIDETTWCRGNINVSQNWHFILKTFSVFWLFSWIFCLAYSFRACNIYVFRKLCTGSYIFITSILWMMQSPTENYYRG